MLIALLGYLRGDGKRLVIFAGKFACPCGQIARHRSFKTDMQHDADADCEQHRKCHKRIIDFEELLPKRARSTQREQVNEINCKRTVTDDF